MPGCNGAGTAERSYPTRSGAATGRSYPTSEVRGGGQEELPTPPPPNRPHLRPGAAPGRSYLTSEVRGGGPRVPGCDSAGAAERSYTTSEVRAAAGRS